MMPLSSRSEVAALREHGLLVLLAVVVLASVLLGVFSPPAAREVQIDSQRDVNELICVPWVSDSFPINRGSALGLSKVDSESSATAIRVDGEPTALRPGELIDLGSGRTARKVLVEGPAAKHVSTMVWAATDQGMAKGAAMDECRAPGQSWWFAGLDTTAGSSAALVLVNPDNEDVIATVHGFGPEGAIDVGGGRRLLVRAESRTVVDLNLAFPAQPALVVQIGLAEGRVAASVQSWSVKADAPRGRSFAAPMQQPVTKGAVVGLRDQSPVALLQLLAPDEDATVTVRLSTRGGTSDLAGADRVVLTAGKVETISLAPMISDKATTLVVESSHPVVAAVRQIAELPGAKDLEIQTLQPNVTARASVAVGAPKGTRSVSAYSEAGAVLTYQVYQAGKLAFAGSTEVKPTTSALVEFSQPLPAGAVVVFETDGTAALTLWLYRSDGNSANLAIHEETATVLAGTSLMLSTS